MQDSIHLLTLPRELRDGIFVYLVYPPHIYTSSPKPNTHLVRRTNLKVPDAYIDTRIYLPVQPASNILATCHQLRDEYLSFIAHLASSTRPRAILDWEDQVTPDDSESETRDIVHAQDSSEEKEMTSIERSRDIGCARFTLEIMRTVRGNMGAYEPIRLSPSPIFLSLLPILSCLRKVKFIVWPGWGWWYGPAQSRLIRRATARATFKRTTPDQVDEMRFAEPQDEEGEGERAGVEEVYPDALAVAIGTLMKHLPLVEEVHIDVLMNAFEYWNLDLPDPKWRGVEGWLGAPIHIRSPKTAKVYSKLIACQHGSPIRTAAFCHKVQTRTYIDGKLVVHVAEGFREVSDVDKHCVI